MTTGEENPKKYLIAKDQIDKLIDPKTGTSDRMIIGMDVLAHPQPAEMHPLGMVFVGIGRCISIFIHAVGALIADMDKTESPERKMGGNDRGD